MTTSSLTRLGGLAAVIAGALFIISDLALLLLALSQTAAIEGLIYLRTVATLGGGVLLVLGLVGLYANRSGSVGILGLVGFLAAFTGSMLSQRGLLWAALLANLGWVLFGAASLINRGYPRIATIILVVGAALSGLVNLLVGSSGAASSPAAYAAVGVADLIFNVAVVWLGFSLFAGRSEEAQQPTRVR